MRKAYYKGPDKPSGKHNFCTDAASCPVWHPRSFKNILVLRFGEQIRPEPAENWGIPSMRPRRFAAFILMCAVMVGTRSAGGQVRTPAPPPTSTPAPAPAVKAPYVLQRGDEITVKVFNNNDLLDTVIVRPDGKITVLLLDDVQAAGLTAAELDGALTAGYSKFFREPQVSVIVRSFSNLRVYVGGEVGQPGPVSLRGDVTALEAILQVGGFRPTARMDSVVLLRNDGNDKPVVQKLNFKELLAKGGGADMALQPFDVLYVPVSRIGKVDRFVDQYVRQLLPISLTAGFQYIVGDQAFVVSQ